jgi:omega-6 fatty acid desaturase (delta-12 desaturase)
LGHSIFHQSLKTGKELILATKPFASDSTARSWWCVLSTTFLLAASLVGTIWNFHLAGQIACSVLAGLLILRLFVIYHDQQHYAILPKSRIAELFMKVFGILSLSPSSIWRSSHNYHHNHNSQLRGSHIGSFPVMTRNQFLKSSRGRQIKYLFIRHPLTILFGYVFAFLFGMCLYPFYNKPKEHFDCAIAFVVHFLISAALLYFFGWQALLLAQIVPHFVACAIGTYLFYAQHNFPSVSFYDRLGWAYEKAALDSSSYMKTGPIMGWFTANIGYHHIHHLNARVPFYRLPEVMRAIPELRRPKTTSLHPLEILRCLRLKLWDVEAQKMILLPRKTRSSSEQISRPIKHEAETP